MKGKQLEPGKAELKSSFSGIPLEKKDKPDLLNYSKLNMEISNFGLLDQNFLQYFDKQALFGYIKLLEELVKRLRNNSSAETQPKEVRKDKVKSEVVNEVTSNLTRNCPWHKQGSSDKFIESDKSWNKARSKVETSKEKVCTYCNLWHVSTKGCPALGKKCHRCKKLNHFSAVCRTKLRKANSASSDEFSSRVVETFPTMEIEKDLSVETKTSGPANESNTGHSENRGSDKMVDRMDTPDGGLDSDVKKGNSSTTITNKKDCNSNEKKSKVKKADPQISKEKKLINWINKELKTKLKSFEDLKDGKIIRSLFDMSMGLPQDWHSSESVWNDIKIMITLQEVEIDEDKLEAGQRAEVEKLIDWLKKRKENEVAY